MISERVMHPVAVEQVAGARLPRIRRARICRENVVIAFGAVDAILSSWPTGSPVPIAHEIDEAVAKRGSAGGLTGASAIGVP